MGIISGFYTMPHPPIVVPEVGKGEQKKIQKTYDACIKVANEIYKIKPDTIIIVTPHGTMFSDVVTLLGESSIQGSLAVFNTPNVKMHLQINLELTQRISEKAEEMEVPNKVVDASFLNRYGKRFELDHGAIVPLYFINQKYSNYNLVHITYSMLSPVEHYKFGTAIKKAVEQSDSNAVFIASGDLSHRLKEEGPYGYNENGPKFDRKILELLEKGEVKDILNMDPDMLNEAGECGLKSYYIMLGAMDASEIKGNLMSYEDTFGVGYGVMSFDLKASNRDYLKEIIEEKNKNYEQRISKEDIYVRLARESLTNFIITGKYIKIPDYVTEEMIKNRRGVFVSLKKYGNLRGCIGTILSTRDSIAEEIIKNAVEAATEDPRFEPVEESELEDLVISVDVLTEPTKATKEELNPKKYGIIVSSGRKRALLLPDLEGINTTGEQLSAVLNKGGISPDESYVIEKFEVIRHK